jgi:hypothetical protein
MNKNYACIHPLIKKRYNKTFHFILDGFWANIIFFNAVKQNKATDK